MSTTVTPRQLSAGRSRDRQPHRAASDVNLAEWLESPNLAGIEQVLLIRTSSSSLPGFEAMFTAGLALLPNDPDVIELAAIGPGIVLDEGASVRDRLGALELRRGAVPGGKGRARLGWLVPIGRTLFVLALQSARKADIKGASRDRDGNSFTEALCTVIRTVQPTSLHAPLFTRLVREPRYGSQVLHALAEYNVTLFVEGQQVPLEGSEAELSSMLKSWFASADAAGTVARLTGIEASMYSDGEWYLTSKLLPFTWRAAEVERVEPITGQILREVPDRHVLEVTPGSVAVFDMFVALLCDASKNLDDIGRAIGAAGVLSRAPKDFGSPPLLSDLNQPGHAVSRLIQDRWLTAWRTGMYRTRIALKADLRRSHPGLLPAITADELGKKFFLDVEIPMPVPSRGYWLSEEDHARILEVRKAPTPQRVGRAASAGKRRPLSSLSQWDDEETGRQYRLGTFDSTATYTLLWRPLSHAYTAEKCSRGWSKQDKRNKMAVVSASALHASLGEALIDLATQLEGRTAALSVPSREPTVASPKERAEETLFAAQASEQKVINRLKGIRAERQSALGAGDASEVTALEEDRTVAQSDLADAAAAVAAAERQLAKALEQCGRSTPAQAEEQDAEASLATLEVLGVTLTRCGTCAPSVVSDALARLFGESLRVYPVADNVAIRWEATVTVPLVDGTRGTFALSSPEPVAGIAYTIHKEGGDAAPDWQARLAAQYFGNGLDFAELGKLRNLNGSGRADTYLVKQMKLWVRDHGVAEGMRTALIDAPREVRKVVYRLLTGSPARNAYEGVLLATYTDPHGKWCQLWAAETHDDTRAATAAIGTNTTGADVMEVMLASQVPLARLAELTRHSRRVGGGQIKVSVGPALARMSGSWLSGSPARGRVIGLLRCPHEDCPSSEGASTGLVQLVVPELGPAALICPQCHRLPDNAQAVFPALYLAPWRGGRRQSVTIDGQVRYVGSYLPADESALYEDSSRSAQSS